jgi:hypothetical protein
MFLSSFEEWFRRAQRIGVIRPIVGGLLGTGAAEPSVRRVTARTDAPNLF